MKGSECRLIEYMEGSKKRFVIPVYQRNYDWKTENCKQLYDDLIKIDKNKRKNHFFGSLVSVFEPNGRNTEFLVIDGQQRLTTVSLLFLAMYNLINNGIIIPEDATLGNQIYEEFLVDKYRPENKRMKLKPVKNDQNAFIKLFADKDEYIIDSNLTSNYNYFYDRIQKQEITIDELFNAICGLEIINIILNNEDNPQLIFESLNSTGLDLSEGDKIRNFILMGLTSNEQDEYYDKYWNRIEKYTNYNVSAFARDYLSIKQFSIPSQSKIYLKFKEYVENVSIESESLLKDLLSYAKRYEILLKGNTEKKALNACINRLNRLETTITRPFFLEVLKKYDEEEINIEQVTKIFLMTENYLFRRNICSLPTNVLNKIFLFLNREVIKLKGNDDSYVEKLKYILLSKKERSRFPSDEEFSTAFAERSIYQMQSKNKIYILERLENYGTIEDKDVYSHYDDGIYSIEHIMPQHLTPEWVKELGDDAEEIHETWLHRIANLTLTAYNSKYSNYSFKEKKKMKNGFEDSGIRMNTYIAKHDKWTLVEMEERCKYLIGRSLEIWQLPTTNFKPLVKQLDSYTLDDEILCTGRVIVSFNYKNVEQRVSSWADMYQKVLQLLYDEDKSVITKLAVNNDEGLCKQFSMNELDYRKSGKIGKGIFVLTNSNTKSKLTNLKKIFQLYGIDLTDLSFQLRDENEKNENEIGTRKELYRNYWRYTLGYLNEFHGVNGSFCNVNPSKENWLTGYIGVNGFYLCCVVNNAFARVDVYFAKSNKEENKKAFDKLVQNKYIIESNLGIKLIWSRGDDIKSSKISYQLNDVSVSNEMDWLQMARFHAEWSKKFFDVIIPYLK